MTMSYAKVQPLETCVHEVYLPESKEIDGYIGFYVYLIGEEDVCYELDP